MASFIKKHQLNAAACLLTVDSQARHLLADHTWSGNARNGPEPEPDRAGNKPNPQGPGGILSQVLSCVPRPGAGDTGP